MTRTITIDQLEFIVATEPAQPMAPVESPRHEPRYYCPECETSPVSIISTGTCTPSRHQATGGVVASRCEKHMNCSRCNKKLPSDKRFICLDCESWNEYGA